jgi:aryl-alcohol dehydrogenase-like predicted oxidoreductase
VVPALNAARRVGQEIVVRSVLCKGLLTDRRRCAQHLDGAVAVKLDGLDARAEQWGYSLPELAIRFALDTPGVDVVLVSASSVAELATAVAAAARVPLEPEQWESLAEFDCSSQDWVHPERWAMPN